jgi:GAF domain-containing protein
MEYVRCAACGRVAIDPADAWGDEVCSSCGAPLAGATSARVPSRTGPGGKLAVLVRLARDLVDTDVAMVTEVSDGRELVREAAGLWPPLKSLRGSSLPLEDTFCQRLLEGRIGNLVSDVQSDERVRDLAMARQLQVGAYLGVPMRTEDARLYVLCCLAREARPDLDQGDVNTLMGLCESMLIELRSGSPER